MSAALRAREQAAIAKLGRFLGVAIDPGKLQANQLEELAEAAETLLGPAHTTIESIPVGPDGEPS